MKNGFVAITTVMILSVVVLAIAASVTYLSIGEAQSSLSLFKGEDNLNFVEGCAEDYLLKIRANASFPGGNITHLGTTCTINIVTGNPDWNIIVSSLDNSYQRKIEIIFTRNTTGIVLNSWREI